MAEFVRRELADSPVRILEDDAAAAIGGTSGNLICSPTLAGRDSFSWTRCAFGTLLELASMWGLSRDEEFATFCQQKVVPVVRLGATPLSARHRPAAALRFGR